MPDPDRRRGPDIDTTDARAGSREGVVRWVLLISLSLTVIAFAIIVITGALSQGPIESEGTSTGRIEAQREAEGGGEGSSIDGINPDVGDSFSNDEEAGAATR